MTRVFHFSKKQGHKWLAGILLTEVWASDWIPPRLGTEREIRGLLGEQHSVICQECKAAALPADCPPVHALTPPDPTLTQTHGTHSHTSHARSYRHTETDTDTPRPTQQQVRQTDTETPTETQTHSPAGTLCRCLGTKNSVRWGSAN